MIQDRGSGRRPVLSVCRARKGRAMRQKVFVQSIGDKEDMTRLEEAVGGLLGGEHNKCSLVRCNEFVQLRLCALYGKGSRPVHVYGEGLQITLDMDNVASVYLLSSLTDADEPLSFLGKRVEPDERQPCEDDGEAIGNDMP